MGETCCAGRPTPQDSRAVGLWFGGAGRTKGCLPRGWPAHLGMEGSNSDHELKQVSRRSDSAETKRRCGGCWVAVCKSCPLSEPQFPLLSNEIQNLCLGSASESGSMH